MWKLSAVLLHGIALPRHGSRNHIIVYLLCYDFASYLFLSPFQGIDSMGDNRIVHGFGFDTNKKESFLKQSVTVFASAPD
jgi:hypothetical protein